MASVTRHTEKYRREKKKLPKTETSPAMSHPMQMMEIHHGL